MSKIKTKLVLSALDRDQGDAVIPIIMKAEEYPYFTSWEPHHSKKTDSIEAVEAALAGIGGYVTHHSPLTHIYVSADNTVTIDMASGQVFCGTASIPFYQWLSDVVFPFMAPEPEPPSNKVSLFSYTMTPMGVADRHAYLSPEDFQDFNPSFYPEHPDNWLAEYMSCDENIVIFEGVPGSGKTCLARYIAMHMAISSGDAIHTTDDRACLTSVDFWNSLRNGEAKVLILDDVDEDLQNRRDNAFAHNLLTFSNGIESNDCKIIITTNQPALAIDDAITRPQRCFDVFRLEGMTRESACQMWINEFGRTIEEFEYFFAYTPSPGIADLISNRNRTRSGRRRFYQGSQAAVTTTSNNKCKS